MEDTSLKTLFLININETNKHKIIIAVKRERNRTDEKPERQRQVGEEQRKKV